LDDCLLINYQKLLEKQSMTKKESAATTLPAAGSNQNGDIIVQNDISEEEALFLTEQNDELFGDDTDQIYIVAMSKEKQHQENFYSPDLDMEFSDGLSVVLLKPAIPGCIKMPDDYDAESEPECKSDDGINPSPAIKEPYCTEPDCCKAVWDKKLKKMLKPCPYGNWSKDKKGKDKPPTCKEARKLLILEESMLIPFWYVVKSTAMSPWRKFEKMLKARVKALSIKRVRAGMSPAAVCMFRFHIGSVQRAETSKGVSYIPVFSGLEEITDPDTIRALVATAIEHKDANLMSLADEDEDFGDSDGTEPDF
jgi:hypothetical protein